MVAYTALHHLPQVVMGKNNCPGHCAPNRGLTSNLTFHVTPVIILWIDLLGIWYVMIKHLKRLKISINLRARDNFLKSQGNQWKVLRASDSFVQFLSICFCLKVMQEWYSPLHLQGLLFKQRHLYLFQFLTKPLGGLGLCVLSCSVAKSKF